MAETEHTGAVGFVNPAVFYSQEGLPVTQGGSEIKSLVRSLKGWVSLRLVRGKVVTALLL